MNQDKIAEYLTLAVFVMILLIVFSVTSALTYKLVLWIIGG